MAIIPFAEAAPGHPAFTQVTQALDHSPLPAPEIRGNGFANPTLVNITALQAGVYQDPLPGYREPLGSVVQD